MAIVLIETATETARWVGPIYAMLDWRLTANGDKNHAVTRPGRN